jgi:hypothetical protein
VIRLRYQRHMRIVYVHLVKPAHAVQYLPFLNSGLLSAHTFSLNGFWKSKTYKGRTLAFRTVLEKVYGEASNVGDGEVFISRIMVFSPEISKLLMAIEYVAGKIFIFVMVFLEAKAELIGKITSTFWKGIRPHQLFFQTVYLRRSKLQILNISKIIGLFLGLMYAGNSRLAHESLDFWFWKGTSHHGGESDVFLEGKVMSWK